MWTRQAATTRPWFVAWVVLTIIVSAAATLFDAVLLQLRRSYFTGGFLATDYVTSPIQGAGFIVGSLLADAAVVGVIAALGLWLFGRLGVRRNLAFAIVVIVALAPIVAANVVEYELLTYLGDAFDFRLLFDLSGRSPAEIIAVSSAHAARVAWLAAGGAGIAAVSLFVLLRFLPGRTKPLEPTPFLRGLVLPVAVVVTALIVTTAFRNGSDVLDNGLRRKPTGRVLGAVVEAATDVDRDGYGVLGRPDDPGLFDSRVRPYALDLPGDGVDEDGVGGDLPATTLPYREAAASVVPWQSKRDVVLVVLESFRADARGAIVNGKPVTPVLDALAANGIAPQLAFSHNGYTVQSRRHIFTGSTADIRGHDTLIDDFKRNGYQVAYFSGQDESFGGARQGIGFDRADVAYDARQDRERRYSDFSTAGSLAVPYDVLEDRIKAFLMARHDERPLFLYVNFHDTHFPYHHRSIETLVSPVLVDQVNISPEHADAVREMYLNTAANVDRAIGNVLELVARTRGHKPGVVVLGDHGESLFDEGFLGHGYALNDAQTKIPLVVSNLPLKLVEPFAQADLRDAIGRALALAPDEGAKPTVALDPSRKVFQYLGLITRPVQISLTGAAGRTVYDFRDGRIRVGDGGWQRPAELSPADRAVFLEVVQTWERMMLARRAPQDDD